jgi:hypothetical protein
MFVPTEVIVSNPAIPVIEICWFGENGEVLDTDTTLDPALVTAVIWISDPSTTCSAAAGRVRQSESTTPMSVFMLIQTFRELQASCLSRITKTFKNPNMPD